MAHTCPECGLICHCYGDIDDVVLGSHESCVHPMTCEKQFLEEEEYDFYPEEDWPDDGL